MRRRARSGSRKRSRMIPRALRASPFAPAAVSLSADDVRRIAELARLDLAPDEETRLQGQLNAFFSIVEQMSKVDTSGVEPLTTPLAAVQEAHLRLRDDAVTEAVDRDANQASAPLVAGGLYLVPRVIE